MRALKAVLFFLFLPDFCPTGKNLEEKIVEWAFSGETCLRMR
jgi:hypothetical protein